MQQNPNRLRETRCRIGLRQDVLAQLTGISADKLSKIEHNKRGIKQDELVTLALTLGLAPSELVGPTGSAQLRPGEAPPANVRKGLEVLDRFIENCYYVDGLAALNGEA